MSDSSYGSVMVEGVVYVDEREIAKRDAEIERLRGELAECERVGGKFMEEIERLRLRVQRSEFLRDRILRQRDGLLAGVGQKDSEIERLREHITDMLNAQECACGYERPDDVCLGHFPKWKKQQDEIERLRGLLRETLEQGYIRVPYGASHEDVSAIRDFEKRIKEAI